jgi:hypothetical protein
MKRVMVSVALGAILVGGTADAAIRAIDGLGNLYNIETDTAVATKIGEVPDVPSNGGTNPEASSPNSIGVGAGGNYYTSFAQLPNGANNLESLYRDGDQILQVPVGGPAIEAGDAVGDKFYFVDGDGTFITIANISTTSPAVESRRSSTGALIGDGARFGDLAIKGSTAYLSYRENSGASYKLASFDITAEEPTLTNVIADTQRYVGLAFDPTYSSLFGIQRAAPGGELVFRLLEIDLGTGNGTRIADIAGLAAGAEFTDAATIPLPAAAWLLITAAGSLFGARLLRREAA